MPTVAGTAVVHVTGPGSVPVKAHGTRTVTGTATVAVGPTVSVVHINIVTGTAAVSVGGQTATVTGKVVTGTAAVSVGPKTAAKKVVVVAGIALVDLGGIISTIRTSSWQIDVENAAATYSTFFPALSFQLSSAPPLAAPNWVDTTVRVLASTSNRGRPTELQDFAAGTASISLDNSGGYFDSDNAQSPIAALLTINRRARLTATWAGVTKTLWDMFVDEWPVDDDPSFESRVLTVTLTDAFGFLAARPIAPIQPFLLDDPTYGLLDAGNVFAGPVIFDTPTLSGIRIQQVLSIAGWPPALTDIDDGITTVAADTPTDDILTYCHRLARSEMGSFYVSADGTITYRQRHADAGIPEQAVSQLVLDDQDIFAPYTSITIDPASKTRVKNMVTRTSAATGSTYTTIDSTSVQTCGPLPDSQTDLLTANYLELVDQANYVLGRYANGVTRINSVTVENVRAPDAELPVMIAADMGWRLSVGRTPKIGGAIVMRDAHIEGVTHTISAPATFRTTWALLEVDLTPRFTLDDPLLGLLDAGNFYGY